MLLGRSIVLVCGPGEAGKDELSNMLCRYTELQYRHSTSHFAAKEVFRDLQNNKSSILGPYRTAEECWEDRRNHRVFWAEWIRLYNLSDGSGSRLYREMVTKGQSDILTGIRDKPELEACKRSGLCDLSIWVQRDACKPDPTQKFGPDDCDLTIYNNGTLEDLNDKVRRIHGTLLRVLDI